MDEPVLFLYVTATLVKSLFYFFNFVISSLSQKHFFFPIS